MLLIICFPSINGTQSEFLILVPFPEKNTQSCFIIWFPSNQIAHNLDLIFDSLPFNGTQSVSNFGSLFIKNTQSWFIIWFPSNQIVQNLDLIFDSLPFNGTQSEFLILVPFPEKKFTIMFHNLVPFQTNSSQSGFKIWFHLMVPNQSF